MTNQKKLPIFYIIYFSAIFLFLLALIIATATINSKLSAYENSRPVHAAQQIFDDYFSGNRDKLFSDSAFLPELSEFETAEHYRAALTAEIGDKPIAYYEVSTGLSGTGKKYSVRADGREFAVFTLKTDGTDKNGSDIWVLDSIRTKSLKTHKITVVAPSDSEITVNGKVPDKKHITGKTETESCKHMPNGVKGVIMQTLEVDGLIVDPEVKITRRGQETAPEYDESTRTYTAPLPFEGEAPAAIDSFAYKAATTYACYMTLDATLDDVAKYFDKNTDTYTTIKNIPVTWYSKHDSYKFKNVKKTEYYSFGSGIHTIRISFDQYVYRGKEEHVFPTDLVLYLRETKGGYTVYDMTVK